jgi:predicted ATPase
MGRGTLQDALGRRVEAELLYQRGVPPQAIYLFKHALIQDTAYQSLLKRTRQQYHQRIAQVLEAQFPDTVAMQPEVLAHHYTEAGLSARALAYWQQAGERPRQRSANVEAVAHLTKGLTLLDALPDSPEHIQHELTLRIALGNALIATRGYAARDVEHAYAPALELCRQLGDTVQLFPVLYGVWVCHLLRAEYTTARELGEEFSHLAQRQQDPGLLLEAHRMLAVTLYCLGECGPAHTQAERGVALYDPKVHHSHALIYGQDPGVSCQMYAAWTLWFLGYPDQALQRSHEALRLARELSHPLSLAMALSFATRLHQLRREGPAAQAQAEVLMALSGEQGFPQYLSHGMVLRGGR